MTDRSITAASAASLLILTVAIGLAGADKRPPASFLLFVGVVVVLSVVAFANQDPLGRENGWQAWWLTGSRP